jgi:hypothetical protein
MRSEQHECLIPTLSEFQVRSMLENLGARISSWRAKTKVRVHTHMDSADSHAVVPESWARRGWGDCFRSRTKFRGKRLSLGDYSRGGFDPRRDSSTERK